MTVLPADDPNQKPIGWKFTSYSGTEVYKLDAPDVPLTRRKDIKPGDKLIVGTLFGQVEMTATKLDDGELWADSQGMVADLKFDTDDRHCWVSTFGINKKLLKKR